MKRVCCLQFARLDSKRIPNKLLQVVGGETLIDRGCRYLRALADRTGVVPILGVQPKFESLIAAAEAHGVEVLPLDERASEARIWPELVKPYATWLADRFEVVWDANILLRPFLRLETGEFIVRQCQATRLPWVGVIRRRGIVWSEASPTPVIGAGELADTHQNPHFFEPSHLAYVWPVSHLLDGERELAEAVTPLEIPLTWQERIDIDSPEDLEMARLVAGGAMIAGQDAMRRR